MSDTTGNDIKTYRITVTITNTTPATDSGGWQIGMSWRKTLLLDPKDSDKARALRSQATAASYEDDMKGMRDLNRQAETVIHDEWKRLRQQARNLIAILNGRNRPVDAHGMPLWDRGYALYNSKCWQWELVAAQSTCVSEIMAAAGIDDWPPADTMPVIDGPEITINLSVID
ncbi:hypothetical protein COO72_12365 [Bifidobacterium callitrichos]|uniref:hypothetical protein n=1 Tax=Bifidobacterium rousetti TaxID=2045439 RepID=UPI000D143D55|nr:hypothetical protein [Bifidobacterium rousetti]PST47067.1 hypothetical protein COO72_12365 [Bifidobacterium callitrichos]